MISRQVPVLGPLLAAEDLDQGQFLVTRRNRVGARHAGRRARALAIHVPGMRVSLFQRHGGMRRRLAVRPSPFTCVTSPPLPASA